MWIFERNAFCILLRKGIEVQRTYNWKGEFKLELRGGLPARFMWGCVTGYQVQGMALGGRHYMALVGI